MIRGNRASGTIREIVDETGKIDPMEQAKRIMKRLAETPYEPHKPLRKRPSKNAPAPKTKERPASKGHVHKGKTRK
jgi:hypothetical protein